ncbi:T9SS type A sorting domain-containing protein [Flammeovirga sp. SR4]|uniref:T9SS type A sorting domain-containing protein n=2 Tax=Flammeovirga agarivorans TaxID=2726742 RepID=A0A7X8XYX0_9BACT|nr:T9SS type A sorting domain-containing protein [Flammeovirga agarivorans]
MKANYCRNVFFMLTLLFLSSYNYVFSQTYSSVTAVGNALPEGVTSYPLTLQGNYTNYSQNYEGFLLLERGKSFQIKADDTFFGASRDTDLVEGLNFTTSGEEGIGFYYIKVSLGDYKKFTLSEIKSLGVQIDQNSTGNFSNEIPLSIEIDEANLSVKCSVGSKIFLGERFKVSINHDPQYYLTQELTSYHVHWDGISGLNSSDVPSEFNLNFYPKFGEKDLQINTEKFHLLTSVEAADDDYMIFDTQLDNNENVYSVGSCNSCDADKRSVIIKDDGTQLQKKYFSIELEGKKGHQLAVSKDGEHIAILARRRNGEGFNYDGQSYVIDGDAQLVLILLDESLDIITTKELHISQVADDLISDGYGVTVDNSGNFLTQHFVNSNELTINESQQTISHTSAVVISKFSNNGASLWNTRLDLDNQTVFNTSLIAVNEYNEIALAIDARLDNFYKDGSYFLDLPSQVTGQKLFIFKFDNANGSISDSKNITNSPDYEISDYSELFALEGAYNDFFLAGRKAYLDKLFSRIDNTDESHEESFFVLNLSSSWSNYQPNWAVLLTPFKNQIGIAQNEQIKLFVDKNHDCYLAFLHKRPFEVYNERAHLMSYDNSKGLSFLKIEVRNGHEKFKVVESGSIKLISDSFDFNLHSIFEKNGKVNIIGSSNQQSSYINNDEIISFGSDISKNFKLTFDSTPYISDTPLDNYWSSKSFVFGGTDVDETPINSIDGSLFEGLIFIENNEPFNIITSNGDKWSVDEENNIIVSEDPIYLEGKNDQNLYIAQLDYQKQKMVFTEVETVGYTYYKDEKIDLESVVSNKDYEFLEETNSFKFSFEDVTLKDSLIYIINSNPELTYGEATYSDDTAIPTHNGNVADIHVYFDCNHSRFGHEILHETSNKILDVLISDSFDYKAIEKDKENNIYRTGLYINNEDTEGSVIEKLDAEGKLIKRKYFTLETQNDFGNTFKVDPYSGNMILALNNSEGKTSFIYDGKAYNVSSENRTIFLYLNNELEVQNVVGASASHSSEYSVTIDNNGVAFYCERIKIDQNSDFNIYKLTNDTNELFSTIHVDEISGYYFNMITVDQSNHLYLSGEFLFDKISLNEEEILKDVASNFPIICINTETKNLEFANTILSQPLMSGGYTGWPTGFQAGKNSVHVTGWVKKDDNVIGDLFDPYGEGNAEDYYSNFILEVDSKGNPIWGQILRNNITSGGNYGYTRLEVDENNNAYYLLDIRDGLHLNEEEVILMNEKRWRFFSVLKYNNGELKNRLILKSISWYEDLVHIDNKIFLTGMVSTHGEYFRYQDFTHQGINDTYYGVSVIASDLSIDDYENTGNITWEIDMNNAIENNSFTSGDELVLEISGENGYSSNSIEEHFNNVYTFTKNIPYGDIDYTLYINNEKEEISYQRTYTVESDKDTIHVIFQTEDVVSTVFENVKIDVTTEGVFKTTLEDQYFTTLGDELEYTLVLESNETAPTWFAFDISSKELSVDLNEIDGGLTSLEKKQLLDDYRIDLILADNKNQSVIIELTLNYNNPNDDITALQDELEKHFNVYPTLTKDILNINSITSQPYTYNVTNLKGQLIENGIGSSTTKIKTSEYQSGLYILTLKTDEGIYVAKFIKN